MIITHVCGSKRGSVLIVEKNICIFYNLYQNIGVKWCCRIVDGVSPSHSTYAGLVGKKTRCDDEHRKIFVFYMRQCIGQRNPVPFLRRHPREKHMLSETLDARAFKALGVGDAPFPRQPIGRIEPRRLMTNETENETVDGHPAQPCADTGLDAGDEFDGVCR